MNMREESRLDLILQGVVFAGLFATTESIMNIVYKPIFALLLATIGVLMYRLMVNTVLIAKNSGFRVAGLPSMLQVLAILHLLLIPMWLLIPASAALYFVPWGQIFPGLLLRALIAISYACIVPGTILVMVLDYTDRFTALEVFVLGSLSSLFLSSLVGYVLYTVGLSLTLFVVPTLWVLASLLFILRFVTRRNQGWLRSWSDPPSSFNSDLSLRILLSISSILLIGVIVINVQWYDLLGGDLWTHAAQTAYFLQGDNTITYPWAFHFLVASLWGVSGLPLVNIEQLLQVFAILPVLALFATVSAYSGKDSKIPALSTLFFALFMGLGWISYLYQRITIAPSTLAGLFGIDSGAGAVTYDIAYGILSIRLSFLPAILALSCLIISLRLLRGFRFPWPSLIFITMILTFLSTASHLVETGFFAAVLLIAAIFKGELDEMTTLVYCELGAAFGLGFLFVLDSLSPNNQRIFSSSVTSGLYAAAFSDEVYLLLVALLVSLLRTGLLGRGNHGYDIMGQVYSRVEPYVNRIENRLVYATLILTSLLGVFFTIYTLQAPPFSVFDIVSSASVPWNYYPIRIGVVTFFALMGSAIIILHLETLRKYMELFALAAIAIFVGRLIDLFGVRPFNFGENRVMDILWVAVTPLAGFGLVELAARLPKHFKLRDETKKMLAAVIVIVIIFAGTASSLLLIDKLALQGQIPGYAATNDDMQVISYIIQHRNSISASLTAPTLLSQFKIREMTLNYPLGYFNQFSILPFFQSGTITGLFNSANIVLGTNIFVSEYDVSYLSEHGYIPVLWFLAYQPAIVDAQSSFLISPLRMNPATGSTSSLTILQSGANSLADFLGTSTLALTSTTYALGTTSGALPGPPPYVILLNDPSDPILYSSMIAWARMSNRTLAVVANSGAPGLFETQLFKSQDIGVTFNASQIYSDVGGSLTEIMLPNPLTIHEVVEQNATIVASFQNGKNNSTLAAMTSIGSGHVLLLSLRDYYRVLSRNMFTEVGRALFRFMPIIFQISGVPLSP